MNCEWIEAQLDAFADREIRGTKAWRVRRHVRFCLSCAEKLDRTLRIGVHAHAWADVNPSNEWLVGTRTALVESSPSSSIDDRVELDGADIGGSTEPVRGSRSRRLAARLAGAGVLTVAVAAGFAITGNRTADVKSAHSMLWMVGSRGRRVKLSETWSSDGWFREWFGGRVNRITGHGKLWSYDLSADLVTICAWPNDNRSSWAKGRELEDKVDRMGVVSRLAHFLRVDDLEDRFRRSAPSMLDTRFEDLGRIRFDGRQARLIASSLPSGFRTVYTIDSSTHLVIRTENQHRLPDGTWGTYRLEQTWFNRQLPESTFDPKSFSPTARIVDRDQLEATWKRRLLKPIARQRLAGGTVAIRDVERNADGDLFVLYTQGNDVDVSIGWNAVLTDGSGTQYLRRKLDIAEPDHGQLFLYHGKRTRYRDLGDELRRMDFMALKVGGDRLFGDMWIPLLPSTRPLARAYSLKFSPHSEPLRAHRLVKRLASGPATVRFSLNNVPMTVTGLLPSWAACMTGTMAPLVDLSLDRNLARAKYFEDHNDTQRALIFNRLLIRHAHEFQSRFGGLADPWFDVQRPEWRILASIGDECSALGHISEARKAYEESLKVGSGRVGAELVAAKLAWLGRGHK